MGSITNLDKDNIITATMEELTKEEHKSYLVPEEHFMVRFLKGFKKNRGGFVKRVEEFIMPSFKLSNNQIEEIPNVSNKLSDLLTQLSLMLDQKISVAQLTAGDMCLLPCPMK